MQTHKSTSRHFIRHPSDIPIEILFSRPASKSSDKTGSQKELNNISYGGLSFSTEQPLRKGDILSVRIAISSRIFEAQGAVSWCKPQDSQYLIGIEFLDQDDAFMARMVEQICHIEHYKHEVYEKEGRSLSSKAASLEWIEKFASKFPNPDNHET